MFNQQAENTRQLEALKDSQNVVVCHYCHSKVTVVDICNHDTAANGLGMEISYDDEISEIEQMADELAGYVGVEETMD